MALPHILIVEDNPLDAQMTCWALAEAGYAGSPVVVDDGSHALALFRREDPFAQHPRPDLVILDLNLKGLDGPDVLRFIRRTPELLSTKVVILSSSPEDVMRAKADKADCYFCKSSSLDVYMALGKKILACYSRLNE